MDSWTLSCIWLLAIFILTSSYKSVILSMLTFPSLESPVDTIEKLAKAVSTGHYEAVTLNRTYSYDFLTSHNTTTVSTIGKSISKVNKLHKINTTVEGFLKCSNLVKDVVYMYDGVNIDDAIKVCKRRKLIKSKETFFNELITIMLVKGFPFRKHLNIAVLRMLEIGLINTMEHDGPLLPDLEEQENKNLTNSLVNDKKFLTINDTRDAFLLLCIGYVSSFIIFLSEVATWKVRLKTDVA